MEDPTIKKLLSVSNISEHKSIKEILNKKEWVEFYDMLKEADDKQITERLPEPCIKACLDFGKENEGLSNLFSISFEKKLYAK